MKTKTNSCKNNLLWVLMKINKKLNNNKLKRKPYYQKVFIVLQIRIMIKRKKYKENFHLISKINLHLKKRSLF